MGKGNGHFGKSKRPFTLKPSISSTLIQRSPSILQFIAVDGRPFGISGRPLGPPGFGELLEMAVDRYQGNGRPFRNT